MAAVGIRQLRENIHDVINFVRTKNGRVVITQYGRPVAELVPVQKAQCPPASAPLAVTNTSLQPSIP